MQLVAYGAQDVFLTGNPQISFFKVVYRRHTNFAMESIEQTFNGNPQLGNKVTCTISRNGDLITNLWLEVELSGGALCNSVGHALIEYVELEIGGQRIDKHYGEWLEIISELSLPEEKRQGFKEMIGRRDAYTAGGTNTAASFDGTAVDAQNSAQTNAKFYIPLQFFFCRNPGLALPLIALQYHEVKINVKLRQGDELRSNASAAALPVLESLRMFADYVYLDTDERRRFAQVSHEYLIEQLQHTGPDVASTTNHRLNFNHPVKELVWVYRKNGAEPMNFNKAGAGTYVDYTTAGIDSFNATTASDWFSTCKLQLNGHDRFSERSASYFRLVQPYQHHTRVPAKHVYVYSFALNPESHQPSGSCNFSRLDNVTLMLTPETGVASDDQLLVYATNYNVLRIMSGMGGLAYSN